MNKQDNFDKKITKVICEVKTSSCSNTCQMPGGIMPQDQYESIWHKSLKDKNQENPQQSKLSYQNSFTVQFLLIWLLIVTMKLFV